MPGWFRGQGKSLREDFEKWVRGALLFKALGALAILSGMGLALWREIWPWLLGIDPETLRRYGFALAAILNLLVLWAPRRRLPIAVAAVEQWSDAAAVSVGNFGESAVFYGHLEVLGGPRGAPVLPTWAPRTDANRIRLNREQPGILFLARAVPEEWAGPFAHFSPFAAALEDAGSYSEQRFVWGRPPNELRVAVRLSITREEEKKRLPPFLFLRPRKSSVSDFVIKGDSNGRLSVEAPAARRWWQRRQAKPATTRGVRR